MLPPLNETEEEDDSGSSAEGTDSMSKLKIASVMGAVYEEEEEEEVVYVAPPAIACPTGVEHHHHHHHHDQTQEGGRQEGGGNHHHHHPHDAALIEEAEEETQQIYFHKFELQAEPHAALDEVNEEESGNGVDDHLVAAEYITKLSGLEDQRGKNRNEKNVSRDNEEDFLERIRKEREEGVQRQDQLLHNLKLEHESRLQFAAKLEEADDNTSNDVLPENEFPPSSLSILQELDIPHLTEFIEGDRDRGGGGGDRGGKRDFAGESLDDLQASIEIRVQEAAAARVAAVEKSARARVQWLEVRYGWV